MKKNIWILNHYATASYFNHGGRHFSLAKYLVRKGHKVTIFCSNTQHGMQNPIDFKSRYKIEESCGIQYVFVKCPEYQYNGIKRISNMVSYYKNVKKIYREFSKPDIIIGSQVHPLACLSAIQISRTLNCKCITEYRDLWPVSIVEYSRLTNSNPIIKVLYSLEKYLYEHSDSIIFTMPGGIDYLNERKYSKKINKKSVYYLNNGVDLDDYNFNKFHYQLKDEELNDKVFKIVYTGSLRLVNGIDDILKSLSLLEFDFKCFLYGRTENELELLQKIKEQKLEGKVFYKGVVEKKYIPFVLSKSDLNIIYWKSEEITKRGISANKIFDYLAAGKPIICNNHKNYDMIETNGCGYSYSIKNKEDYAEAITKIYEASAEEREKMGRNSAKLSKEFDYKVLADKLEKIINETINGGLAK